MHCTLALTGNILSRENIVCVGLASKAEAGYMKYTHSKYNVFSDALLNKPEW